VKKLLAGSIRREMELESLNTRQAAEIQQLNRLVCTHLIVFLVYILTAGDCHRKNTVFVVMPASRWF
jgi:hypothetical protein